METIIRGDKKQKVPNLIRAIRVIRGGKKKSLYPNTRNSWKQKTKGLYLNPCDTCDPRRQKLRPLPPIRVIRVIRGYRTKVPAPFRVIRVIRGDKKQKVSTSIRAIHVIRGNKKKTLHQSVQYE